MRRLQDEMALRVVFFGNSESVFSNRHFLALWAVDCDLVGLVDTPRSRRGSTNPLPADLPPFTAIAPQRGIPIFEPASPQLPEFVAALGALRPDLFLAVGYTQILKPPVLTLPRILAANFHASLLPAYRGLHPVFWCLRQGERWSGLTVHAVDPGIDTGDILYQVRVRTRREDTVTSLYDRIMERSVSLVGRLVNDAGQGALRRSPQRGSNASYFSSIKEQDFRLDWSCPSEQLRRWITITPGQCFFDIGGERVYCLDAEAAPAAGAQHPGELLSLGRRKGIVSTKDGGLSLRDVRLRGGQHLTFAELCKMLDLSPGSSIASPGII
jgi:methionyl-tRNA formyltransferase